MVLELIRNKKMIAKFFLILLIISMLLFCGCDSRYGRYPFQVSEEWYSEEPAIFLSYTQNSNGTWDLYHTLTWADSMKEISIGMQSSYYCVYPAGSNHYEDRLFSGSWKYQNGNLVLNIEEDFLFDGEYSKIILKPIDKKQLLAYNP